MASCPKCKSTRLITLTTYGQLSWLCVCGYFWPRKIRKKRSRKMSDFLTLAEALIGGESVQAAIMSGGGVSRVIELCKRDVVPKKAFRDVVEENNKLRKEKESYKKEKCSVCYTEHKYTDCCYRVDDDQLVRDCCSCENTDIVVPLSELESLQQLREENKKLKEKIKELGPHGGWGGK